MFQVKVMLRVSGPGEGGSFFNADKRKKQITLVDPASASTSTAEDRRPAVSAPKMFAFDAIFTEEDAQVIKIHSREIYICLFVHSSSAPSRRCVIEIEECKGIYRELMVEKKPYIYTLLQHKLNAKRLSGAQRRKCFHLKVVN